MFLNNFSLDDILRLLNIFFFTGIAFAKNLLSFFSRTFWVFKALSFIVSILLIWVIVHISRKTSKEMTKLRSLDLEDFLVVKPKFKSKSLKAWESVQFYLRSENENDLKLAVIETDNIFAALLKTLGYKGENFEERFQKLKPVHFSNLADLENAHRIARRMVIEEEIRITYQGAKSVIEVYEKVFQDVGLIDSN